MRSFSITIEHADGNMPAPIRLLTADKINAARSARLNSIPWEDTPECQSLMVFMAAKRARLTDADSLAEFLEEINDYTIEENTADSVDPTFTSPQA